MTTAGQSAYVGGAPVDTAPPTRRRNHRAVRRSGQVQAFDDELDRFVAAHYQRLVGLAYYRTGNRQAAEDLAQETLLRLVSNWDRVRDMDRPWNWLAVVVVNLSTSRLRRQQVARRAQAVLGRRHQARFQADSQEMVAVLDAVRALPERQRNAVLLRHYVRMSVRETAEAMGCAEGTVKSLTHHGVEQLRRSFTSDIDSLVEGVPDETA